MRLLMIRSFSICLADWPIDLVMNVGRSHILQILLFSRSTFNWSTIVCQTIRLSGLLAQLRVGTSNCYLSTEVRNLVDGWMVGVTVTFHSHVTHILFLHLEVTPQQRWRDIQLDWIEVEVDWWWISNGIMQFTFCTMNGRGFMREISARRPPSGN